MTLLGDRPLAAGTQLASCVCHAATTGLSRVAERDPLLWVFGARGGAAFADNAKYLFLHVAADHPEVRPVWLSTNREVIADLQRHGYEAYYTYSPRGLDLNRRAGVTVLTHGFGDVCMSCSGGALSVMLWHGTPLKRISWDAGFSAKPLAIRAAAAYAYRRLDLLTAASDAVSESFASGFRIDRDVIVPTGYPRNDVLRREIPGQWIGVGSEVRKRVRSLSHDGQVWLYLPTFRRIGGTSGIGEHVDFRALDSVLADRGAYMLVKAHPFERLALGEDVDWVVKLPAATDVYPLLPFTDGLLTDYSSILFDYLLCDRPQVFFPYDLERYWTERGFYYDYESVTPGPVVTEFPDLLDTLDAMLSEGTGRNSDDQATKNDRTASDDRTTGIEADDYATTRAGLRERFCRINVNRSEAVYATISKRLDTR